MLLTLLIIEKRNSFIKWILYFNYATLVESVNKRKGYSQKFRNFDLELINSVKIATQIVSKIHAMDNVFITSLSSESLKNLISSVIEEKIKELVLPKEDTFLTLAETTRLLRISRPTLNSYRKSGIISPGERIGNKILFRRKEIEQALKSVKRYSRHNTV